ncbi:MAG: PQQ-dependent sugar dehydrogenase [Wenzhouxiangellaceae bacterium]
MRGRVRFSCWVALLALAIPALAQDVSQDDRPYGTPPAFEGGLESLAAVNIRNARLDIVFSGLDEPWAFEFLGPNEIVITERGGRLLRIALESGRASAPRAVSGLPEIAARHQQTGLLDIALHPRFDQTGWIYFSYSEQDSDTGRYFRTQVARARLDGDRLHDLRPLLTDGAYGWSPSNFGGALEFDARGHLLISIGDRSEEVLSQRGDRLEGKILRLNDDGGVPADNPFVGDPDIDDRIFALGVRNVQGLMRDPAGARVYMAEHGPLGGDEVNILGKAANYGWPRITYGLAYSTAPIGEGTHATGLEQPIFYYLPSEAISPLLVYRGAMFPEWDRDLLIGALKGRHVSRLDVDGDRVRSEYPILIEIDSRIRDLKTHADGSVWVLTQDGDLLRLSRTDPIEPATRTPNGQRVYELVCAGCHDTGAADAPKLSDACRWRQIAAKPTGTLYRNTLNGIGEMPERGLCYSCSEEHLYRAVDYMLEAAEDCEQP